MYKLKASLIIIDFSHIDWCKIFKLSENVWKGKKHSKKNIPTLSQRDAFPGFAGILTGQSIFPSTQTSSVLWWPGRVLSTSPWMATSVLALNYSSHKFTTSWKSLNSRTTLQAHMAIPSNSSDNQSSYETILPVTTLFPCQDLSSLLP